MPITPFRVWTITFSLSCLAFVFPDLRAIATALLFVHGIVFTWGIFDIRSGFFGKVYCRASGKTNTIALTFDDGPDALLTPEVVDMLAAFGFKATFFVVGRRALDSPEIVKRAFDAGHIIASHDLTHANTSNFRLPCGLFRDISQSQRIIERIIGKRPLLYRPPVGLMNPHVLGVVSRLNMTCVGWSASARDAGNRRTKKLYTLHTLAQPGNIILLHDCLPKPENKRVFLEHLERLLIAIRKKGLRPIGVDELLNVKAYG
jgi:peptidoglycan-N-acetylglucosamine deacetylase